MFPQFLFDTADADYIRSVWEHLSPHVAPRSCLGITTNPNALSKIECNTLGQLETVIPDLCKLVTEMRHDGGGVVWVQTPNSEMPFNEIFEWARYIIEFTDGHTSVGLKIPHWTATLELTDDLADMGVEINVTGIADWATLLKAFQYPGVNYASLIPGRMEEVGIDANWHMEYIDRIRRPYADQKVIAGSMRTVEGLRNSIVRGTVPTIGVRVWDKMLRPSARTGQADFTDFPLLWTNIDNDFRNEVAGLAHAPFIEDANYQLSAAFFDQMNKLGEPIYKEFSRREA